MRHQAVNEALLHEEKLRQVFSARMDPAQGTSAQTLSLMAWALLGLESLPALRWQIDRQAMSALDAVAAYSHLIAGLVELVFHMADTAGVPSVSRLLVALLHAVQATEEAGQERAMGALLYASGHCQEAHQQRLLHLIDAQERSLRVFGDFAEPALRHLLHQHPDHTLPLVVVPARNYNAARFASTLAMLVQAGVPILKALQAASQTLSNRAMQVDAEDAIVLVREGAPLANALGQKKRFPPLVAMFARLGEQTGQLPTMLGRAANQLSTQVQRRALQLATVAEPLLIVGMGIVVGLIVLAVLMPIIQLNQLVK